MILIPGSFGTFLPKSLCHFRFTTVPDSNLFMNETILIFISVDTNILSEMHNASL